jgi:hypothetical protein
MPYGLRPLAAAKYVMNNGPQANSAELPPWPDCDCFCIHQYAGSGVSSCGWRGRIQDARYDDATNKNVCPRCGFATLFRIPADQVDQALD